MIRIERAENGAEMEVLSAMRKRASEAGREINKTAMDIMEDVRLRGFEAVREYSLKFDKAEPRELTKAELDGARGRCDPKLVEAMELSARQIEDYQRRVLSQSDQWESPLGGRVGQRVRGLSRVGIYVPGGTAAYPSSVLMNAVPARVAGVEEIVMLTPPTQNLNDAVLAAAGIAGVDRVIAVGGVQAVAAATCGAGFIPRVDKLVGPGNAYVAAAKRLAFGKVDIDMVAGPSEVLIIADEYANPKYIAADMLSQAEHDVMASAILLTTSEEIARQAAGELERQSESLERRDLINASLRDYGAVIICADLDQCVKLANEIAPEHLEILTTEPKALLEGIINAGAVFLGEYSPEPLGDYMAGPSHVLPTSGTARFFSPLSAQSFLKRMSVIEFDRQSLTAASDGIIALAESEKLTAHANSIRVRYKEE